VSYYFNLRRSQIDFEELAFQRELLKEARRPDVRELRLGTERFALKAFGKHPYKYVLANEAFEIRLGERMSPSCHVQFTSQLLWQCGLDDLLSRFRNWCASVNLTELAPETVARADWAFDYLLGTIDFAADDFVSRFRKDAIHRENGQVQTFTLGRGDFVLRVYDKVAEIEQQSQKFWFFDLWGQRIGVWRIEFQVRGARLHKAAIHTVDDLRSLQNDLLRELATNHTSLRRLSADSNAARWPLHPVWQALVADIGSLPQTGLIRDVDPLASLNARIDGQGRALYGSLKGYAALLSQRDERDTPMQFSELLQALGDALARHHHPVIWQADVSRRLRALRLGQW
jgi:hypothetical protein